MQKHKRTSTHVLENIRTERLIDHMYLKAAGSEEPADVEAGGADVEAGGVMVVLSTATTRLRLSTS